MTLFPKLQEITNIDQLQAQLRRGNGSVRGQFWSLADDGAGEIEVGLSGTYRSAFAENGEPNIIFEPVSEATGPIGPITEESLVGGSVKVISRQKL